MLNWKHVLSPQERLRLILSIPPAAKKMKLNHTDCQKTDIACVCSGGVIKPCLFLRNYRQVMLGKEGAREASLLPETLSALIAVGEAETVSSVVLPTLL